MADLNLGDSDLYIDGKLLGHVRATMVNFSQSAEQLSEALEKFNHACYQWPDSVIEDVLDAEFVG